MFSIIDIFNAWNNFEISTKIYILLLIITVLQIDVKAEEELEIQRQQEYSGFGEKISTKENQLGAQNRKPQAQTIPPFKEIQTTESSISYQEKTPETVNEISSTPFEEIEVYESLLE